MAIDDRGTETDRADKAASEERWHRFFIGMAELVSEKSKDRSTKVGAVLVGPDNEVRAVGYNGFPRGVHDNFDVRHTRPLKYEFTEHAERNVIYNAARAGIKTKGCRLYLNWEPTPCPDCVRGIIQAGIVAVIGPDKDFPNHGKDWAETFKASRAMMFEAGINTIKVPQETKT